MGPYVDRARLAAFCAALEKEAASLSALAASAAPRLKNLGAGFGAGGVVGGLAGSGLGAVQGYRQARAEGASRGQATAAGLGGAGRGALAGGALGSLAGGAAGAVMRRDLTALGQRPGLLGQGARFGQRQVHALTGVLSPQELEAVRGGAYDAKATLARKREASRAAHRAGRGPLPGQDPGLRGARENAARAERAQAMGLTSLPGYARSVRQHGLGPTVAAGLQEQLGGGTLGERAGSAALALGLPAMDVVSQVRAASEPGGGEPRGERLGRAAGGFVGGLVGGGMPLAGNLVAGLGGAAVGGLVGRGVDALRRPRAGARGERNE